MSKSLYDWQKKAVERFANEKEFALVVDCGCGKTLGAIEIAKKKGYNVLVIAPSHTLCNQWKRDIVEDGGFSEDDVFVFSKPEETKGGEDYQRRFDEWLEK